MATSGKQLSSLPSASSIAGNNEFLTWVGNNTAQKVSRDDFIKSLPTYRQPSTAYTVGNIAYHSALPTGYYLECTTAGTTGSGELTISSPSIGGTVSDGTVVWTVSKDLSLSGGVIDGALYNSNNNTYINIMGGTKENYNNGATLHLMGKDFSDFGGFFQLSAINSPTNINILEGRTDGGLTWVGNDLGGSAIVAKSLGANGYIKYASGLIMQWGFSPINTSGTISLNINHSNSTYAVLVQCGNGAGDYTQYSIGTKTSTQFEVYANASGVRNIIWYTIGY